MTQHKVLILIKAEKYCCENTKRLPQHSDKVKAMKLPAC